MANKKCNDNKSKFCGDYFSTTYNDICDYCLFLNVEGCEYSYKDITIEEYFKQDAELESQEIIEEEILDYLYNFLPEEAYEIVENLNMENPWFGEKLLKTIKHLKEKYEYVILMENRELYFWNGNKNDISSNDNASIHLATLFFANQDYFMDILLKESDLDWELIENEEFIKKVCLLEFVDDVKEFVNANQQGMLNGWNDKHQVIGDKLYNKIAKIDQAQYFVEIVGDEFGTICYGDSFWEQVADEKITLNNLYKCEIRNYHKKHSYVDRGR